MPGMVPFTLANSSINFVCGYRQMVVAVPVVVFFVPFLSRFLSIRFDPFRFDPFHSFIHSFLCIILLFLLLLLLL